MVIKFEVCVDSIASAIRADGGANRIELCSALSEGGLTPSVGTLKVLKNLLNIEIFCMLRPRRGDDFNYNDKEIEAVLLDMDILRSHGADGFVFGALTEAGNIHVEYCRRVVANAGNLPVTFHRAFDVTNPTAMHETVEILRDIGFKRILSSGFQQTAAVGVEFLAQLIARHHRIAEIIIMPGAGINVSNLEHILTTTKCTEFHSSARAFRPNQGDSYTDLLCDVDTVRKMVSIARSMGI